MAKTTKLPIALFILPILMSLTACAWQWAEVHQFYSDGHIPYGHFRDASTHIERQAIVERPSVTMSIVFICYGIASSAIWFGRGARWSILILLLWTFLAYLPFGVYNFLLAAQGDATVFI